MTNDGFFDLPLHVQKALMARLLGFQVLVPRRPLLESLSSYWIAEGLVNSICRLADAALDDMDDELSLESFLSRFLSDLKADADRLSPGAENVISEILSELTELVESFCVAPHDPLRELTDAVAQTAADFYQFYGVPVPSDLWDNAEPAFVFKRGCLALSFYPDIHVQAFTRFSSQDWRMAWVYLELTPIWFAPETIAALPRVMLHEYISHVPQGPYYAVREHPDAADSFAEGWMDYVAHCTHECALERRGPSEALGEYLIQTWVGSYREAGDRFNDARRSVPRFDSSAAERSLGTKVAELFHDELRRLVEAKALGSTASADELMYRLSFGLNASPVTNVTRRLFVHKLQLCLLRRSRSDVLVSSLKQWACGKLGIEDLVVRIPG